VSFALQYSGRSGYLTDVEVGTQPLIVGIECRIGSLPDPVFALCDTAAEWCVLPSSAAEAAGETLALLPITIDLHTRLGRFTGQLARLPLQLVAVYRQSLTIEATWLVCPDWPGPAVIGWKGCLERCRFALEPGEEAFYFAAL
jgi:hypothetical protein